MAVLPSAARPLGKFLSSSPPPQTLSKVSPWLVLACDLSCFATRSSGSRRIFNWQEAVHNHPDGCCNSYFPPTAGTSWIYISRRTIVLPPSSSPSILINMSLPESTEILIVGAGPTGLCLALSLHKQGFTDFVVVDSLLPGDNGSRALAVHAATLEVRTSRRFNRLLCAICCTDMLRRTTEQSRVYAMSMLVVSTA